MSIKNSLREAEIKTEYQSINMKNKQINHERDYQTDSIKEEYDIFAAQLV